VPVFRTDRRILARRAHDPPLESATARADALPAAGGIHAITERDQMIGRLLERTEALMTQNEDFRRTLENIDHTIDGFRQAVSKLEVTLEQFAATMPDNKGLEARFYQMESRLDRSEAELDIWRGVRKKMVQLAFAVILMALSAGTVGGTFIRSALGLH
jgi:hypothetical protein